MFKVIVTTAHLHLMHPAFQWMSCPSHGAQQVRQSKLSAASLRCDVVEVLAKGLCFFRTQPLAFSESAMCGKTVQQVPWKVHLNISKFTLGTDDIEMQIS